MEFLNNSKNFSLNRKTYINLRWIGIIGQFITINSVAFIFKFEFNFILANIVVLFGTLSNILLIYYFKKKSDTRKNIFNIPHNRYLAVKFFTLFNWRDY